MADGIKVGLARKCPREPLKKPSSGPADPGAATVGNRKKWPSEMRSFRPRRRRVRRFSAAPILAHLKREKDGIQ